MTVQLTIQNRQAAVAVVPSASSLVIKALKGERFLYFNFSGIATAASGSELHHLSGVADVKQPDEKHH